MLVVAKNGNGTGTGNGNGNGGGNGSGGAPTLLQGAADCSWSTGGAFYNYPFTTYWDANERSYGWEATIANRSQATAGTASGRRLQAARATGTSTRAKAGASPQWHGASPPPLQLGSALRLGHAHDVFDVPYTAPVTANLELGWATWLVQPQISFHRNGTSPSSSASSLFSLSSSSSAAAASFAAEEGGGDGGGEWTSRAFVGTRVSSASHTFCGCQFMRGDARSFRLTEHGRAQLPIVATRRAVTATGSGDGDVDGGSPPWYLGMTRRQIDAEIAATCAPFATRPCPADNETAWAEWAANDPSWVLPPWVEIYGSPPK